MKTFTTIAEASKLIGTIMYVFDSGIIKEVKIDSISVNENDGIWIQSFGTEDGYVVNTNDPFDDLYDTLEEAKEGTINKIKELKN